MNIEQVFSLRCIETAFPAYQYDDVINISLTEHIMQRPNILLFPQYCDTTSCIIHDTFLNFNHDIHIFVQLSLDNDKTRPSIPGRILTRYVQFKLQGCLLLCQILICETLNTFNCFSQLARTTSDIIINLLKEVI